MSLFTNIALLLEHIPAEVQKAAKAALTITTAIDNELQSNTAKEVTAIISTVLPEAEVWREGAVTLLNEVIPSLQAVAGDHISYTGILQRLGAEITSLSHGGHHTIGDYIKAFQVVFEGN